MLPVRIILHPTDLSAYSRPAFELACALARDFGAELVLLHVGREPPVTPSGDVTSAETRKYQEAMGKELYALEVEAAPTRTRSLLVLARDAATEILHRTETLPSDMIVLGTHGRTGLERVLMGSVAEQVVRRASCPVLTVRAPLFLSAERAKPGAEPAGKLAEGLGRPAPA